MRGIFCHSRFAVLLVAGGALLSAQGLTGTFYIHVKDASGQPVGGARIELTSDKLMMPRMGVTDEKGAFRAPLLPPGAYRAVASKEGFAASSINAMVPLGASVTGHAVLNPILLPTVVVSANTGLAKLDKREVSLSENFRASDMEKLPVVHDLDSVARWSPFVSANPSNSTVVAGAASYENKYLVNGVDVNDPYFNNSINLYIEDALEETQLLSNGISAEHGRFMGGVVNAITKRGGNEFSGSFRVTLTNSGWDALKPLQRRSEVQNHLNQTYTATFGGPVIKDKLWFFVAARSLRSDLLQSLPYSGIGYTSPRDQKRWEVGLTFQPHADHLLGLSYIGYLDTCDRGPSLPEQGITPDTLHGTRHPFSLKSLTYDWLMTPSLNFSLLLTEKRQRMEYAPLHRGTSFQDSPVLDPHDYLYKNTYFGFAPEERNNRNFKAVLSKWLEAYGTHEVKVGYEYFEETNRSKNEQSPTGYVIHASGTDYLPGKDWQNITFKFDPATAYVTQYVAPGGTFTSRYHSLFVNDNWTWSKHFNASLGLRYEAWQGDRGAGYQGPDIMSLVPRLGLNYDWRGDGAWQFAATYAQYASKINGSIAQAGTYVGNPLHKKFKYQSGTGFQLADYASQPFEIYDPALMVRMDRHLKAPRTHEWSLQMKHRLGQAGIWTVMALRRDYVDMFEDFIGMDGTVTVEGQAYPIHRWGNVGSWGERHYTALMTSLEDTLPLWGGKLFYYANLTLSRLYGNYDADAANQPGGGTALGDYPGKLISSAPSGPLSADEPLRFKAYGAWTYPLTATGELTCSLAFDYASGRPYSHMQKITFDTASNPSGLGGYSYWRYYGGRGTGRYPDYYTSDLALLWSDKLAYKNLRYFTKLTIYNWLNHVHRVSFDTRGASGVMAGSANSEVFIPVPRFGQATSPQDFLGNRTLECQVGVKF